KIKAVPMHAAVCCGMRVSIGSFRIAREVSRNCGAYNRSSVNQGDLSAMTSSKPISSRIERVEIIPLRMPLETPVKISQGAPRPFIDTLLVRLHADRGVSGVGETQAWRRQGSNETHASLCAVIRDHFEPHLIGRSPFDIAAIMHRLEET